MAARAGASICAKLCSELWSLRTQASGIPLTTLRDFVHEHSSWRDLYLSKLGLPVPWPDHWSALTTVKTMSTDIFYHALWLVVEGAVQDFGVKDDSVRDMFAFEVSQIRDRLKREAMHSAMRIAMLSALATEQGYLRVDPYVYLARLVLTTGWCFIGRSTMRACTSRVKGARTAWVAWLACDCTPCRTPRCGILPPRSRPRSSRRMSTLRRPRLSSTRPSRLVSSRVPSFDRDNQFVCSCDPERPSSPSSPPLLPSQSDPSRPDP